MATSGTIKDDIRTGYRLQIAWSITQNIANNTSSVTAKVQLVSTGASYTINSSANKSGSLTINGTKYTFSFTAALSGNQTKTLYTKTVNVAHNADGTKTVAFAASAGINVTLGGTYYSTVSASGSGVLNTIPRATNVTVSASSVNMGDNITINMPRASGAFDHTLTYKFGNASGTIGSNIGTSKVWEVPLSLASQIPNSTSGTVTITCKTYNGNTLIGTDTVTFTAKVPASVVPSIGSVAVNDADSGLSKQFTSLVQGKSKAKFTITASGAYGAKITAYKTVVEGKTYTGASPTTAVLTGSGNVTAKITVTDSRGRTATVDKTFYRIPYVAPKIITLDGFRANTNGTENYEGKAAKITVNFAISAANNKNTSSYKLEYKLQSASAWTLIESGSGYTQNKVITTKEIFDTDSAYDIQLTITDYFGSVKKTVELPTAFTLLDFHRSGKAVAFGKVAELDETVEFALQMQSGHGELVNSPVLLQAGDDLDNYRQAGHYAFSSGVSTKLLNSPLNGSGSGSLMIVPEGEAGQMRQIITRCSADYREVWERLFYSNAWKGWKLVYNGGGKILWTGATYMTAGHIANLSEPILEQPTGIVLVFSRYENGAAAENNFHHFFVPKIFISEKNGYGHTYVLATNKFQIIGTKYLYVNNDRITGHADNDATGTFSGITFNNKAFVLRYVIGV